MGKKTACTIYPPTPSTRPRPRLLGRPIRSPPPRIAALRPRPPPPSEPVRRRRGRPNGVRPSTPSTRPPTSCTHPPHPIAGPADRRPPTPSDAAVRPRQTPPSPSQRRASPHLTVIIHPPDVKGPTCHAASGPVSPPSVADPTKHPPGGSSCTWPAGRFKAGTAAVVERRRRLHRGARFVI